MQPLSDPTNRTPNFQTRLRAFLVLLACMPGMVITPAAWAVPVNSLPAGVGVSASASLLPDKSVLEEKPGPAEEEPVEFPAPRIPWSFASIDKAWMPGETESPDDFHLMVLETPSPLLSPVTASSPTWQVLAGEDEQAGAGGEVAPAEDQGTAADDVPEAEVGVAPPAEGEEGWVPADVPEGQVDPMAEAPVEPVRDPLLIEQQVGECVVEGEVSDVTSLEPIAGTIVSVIGTGREDETDAQGRFRIGGLPEGTFTVEALKLGYSSGVATTTTRAGAVSDVRIALRVKPQDTEPGVYELPEETVVGEYTEASQGDFNLALDLDSSVTSGISKDDFSKTGVSDAAGAVGKTAGANIVGGKFAVVRGLADRYVTTQFNGASITSADPSRKAVQLDIFPTTAIERIDVAKTYWPTLPGDFGGGTIQIMSLSIPDERIAEFKYKYGGNSTHGNRMLVHPNREIGFWGDVDNAIPDDLLWQLAAGGNPETFDVGGNRITPGSTNNASQQNAQIAAAQEQQQLADAMVGNYRALDSLQSWKPRVDKPEPTESFSVVYGDKRELENGIELGMVAAFKHGTEDKVSGFREENRLTRPSRSWQEETYSRELDWSVYLGGGIRAGENNEISATYFKTRLVSDDITVGTDYAVDTEIFGDLGRNEAIVDEYGASALYYKEFTTISPVIRDTELTQLRGRHETDGGTKFTWGITDSLARESRPHTSTFQNGLLDFTDPVLAALAASNPDIVYDPSLGRRSVLQYSTFVNDGIGTLDSSRETQFIEEEGLEVSGDLLHSFYFTDRREDGPRLDISIGGSHQTKKREQSGRIYLLRTSDWERWVGRNTPAWWDNADGIADFSPGSPLAGDTFLDGSPLPAGYMNLGEYLAAHPDEIANYYNGYGGERNGLVPGTGTSRTGARFVDPDAPYYVNGSELEVRNVDSELILTGFSGGATLYGDFWKFGAGGRWEKEYKSYEVAPSPLTQLLATDPARTGELTTEVFIPAVTGGLDLFDDQLGLNAAWSRTVARPTFHEFLPISSIAQDTGIVRRGNPNLTETGVENFDISADLRFSDKWSGRVSFFHKNLTDPIVVVQRVDLGVNSNTYQNGTQGRIDGFELEGSWDLGPFTFFGNYAYIYSVLEYDVNQGIVVTPLRTRFPFQPSQILNLTLGWEPEEIPWSVYLTTNFTDEYPTILRSDPDDYDVWVLPQLTLDLKVSRKFDFGDLLGTLSVGVKNLTEEDRQFEYRGGPVGGPSPYDGLSFTSEEPGREYYVEFKAEF